jgi:hypothetical protein
VELQDGAFVKILEEAVVLGRSNEEMFIDGGICVWKPSLPKRSRCAVRFG